MAHNYSTGENEARLRGHNPAAGKTPKWEAKTTRHRLAVPSGLRRPTKQHGRKVQLSSSKQSEVLLRTYHHNEAAKYRTQCKGTRAERNTQQAVYAHVKQEQVGAIPHPRIATQVN